MHTRTAAIGVAPALYSTGGGMTSLRCRMLVVHAYLMAGVAMVMMTCAAASNELKGYKGSIAIGIDKRQREKSHVK